MSLAAKYLEMAYFAQAHKVREQGRPLEGECPQCGRSMAKQTTSHKQCDGCGQVKPRVFGYIHGIPVTNPKDAMALMSETAWFYDPRSMGFFIK